MKRRKYDEEEKALILQVGDNYPYNLMEGFRELAVKFDKEPHQIAAEYYYLKKKEAKRKQNISFILVSKKVIVPDRKIVRKGCPIESKNNETSFWKRILRFFGIN